MDNIDLAVQFFLQLAVILFTCRVVGSLARYAGQPQVVAEMIAGVALGPSLLGIIAPEWQAWLFPWDPSQQMRDTQSYLFPAAQLGLALYMFIVGMEFRVDVIRERLHTSLAVSLAGMVAPFVLGAGLAWWLHAGTSLFGPRTSRAEAMLFLGASLCITAFPMLARIIHFKGLTGTFMGTVALGAGAIDDASAWCLLALVLASFDQNYAHAAWNIGGGLAFLGLALGLVRPALRRFQAIFLDHERRLSETGYVLAVVCMSLGAWFTDAIGLHAVFGAFVMGAVMPRGPMTRDFVTRAEPMVLAVFLPLFFTFSGLNTKIGLLDTWKDWVYCGGVLLMAILGKGAACWLAARASGVPPRDALGIGVLMNARGLMELIIINIGLARGIISERLFAMLVIMAVITTLMASPLFERLVGDAQSDRVPN